MTTTLTTNATPTPEMITGHMELIADWDRGTQRARTLGCLSAVVEIAAYHHRDCTTADCDLCNILSQGLAALSAYHRLDPNAGQS